MQQREHYAQRKAGEGFPVVGMEYCSGAVLVTKCTSVISKITPVDNGLALAVSGHFYFSSLIQDAVDDMTRHISINKAEVRVGDLLRRRGEGLAYMLGSAYHNPSVLPFQSVAMLAEARDKTAFYPVDFTGMPEERSGFSVCGGSESSDSRTQRKAVEGYLRDARPDFASLCLDEAVQCSVEALQRYLGKDDTFLDATRNEELHVGILERRKPLRYASDEERKRFNRMLGG